MPTTLKVQKFVNYLTQKTKNDTISTNYFLDFELFLRFYKKGSSLKNIKEILKQYFTKMKAYKNIDAYDDLLLFLLENNQIISKFFDKIVKTQSLLFLGFSEFLVFNSCLLDSNPSFDNPLACIIDVIMLIFFNY